MSRFQEHSWDFYSSTKNLFINYLIEYFGGKDTVGYYETEIKGRVDGNRLLAGMLYDFVVTHLPKGIKGADAETGKLDLFKFPLSNLKIFYRQMHGMVNATVPKGRRYSNFGGIWSVIKLPKLYHGKNLQVV